MALVLSGGGALAAYEIGLIEGMLEREDLAPDFITGTSAGAFNAAILAARVGEGDSFGAAVRHLRKVWLDEVTGDPNRVFRFRFNPFHYFPPRFLFQDPWRPLRDGVDDLRHVMSAMGRWLKFSGTGDAIGQRRLIDLVDLSNLLSTEPFYDLVRDTIDLKLLRESPLRMCAIATSLRTGEVETFWNQDLTDDIGHQVIVASASIPAIFPPMKIGDRGLFADGALRMNTPLKPAIEFALAEAKRGLTLHVLMVDPPLGEAFEEEYGTLHIVNRLYSMHVTHSVQTDMEIARRVNDSIAITTYMQKTFPEADRALRARAKENAVLDDTIRQATRVTIHNYHPHKKLGGVLDLLDFSSENVERLIDLGHDDALRHDHARDGCVLAGPA